MDCGMFVDRPGAVGCDVIGHGRRGDAESRSNLLVYLFLEDDVLRA